MDMHARLELYRRNDGGIDIDQVPGRMIGEEMPAARLAPLSEASVGPVMDLDIGRPLGDLYGIGGP
jgi:hypothetical protein